MVLLSFSQARFIAFSLSINLIVSWGVCLAWFMFLQGSQKIIKSGYNDPNRLIGNHQRFESGIIFNPESFFFQVQNSGDLLLLTLVRKNHLYQQVPWLRHQWKWTGLAPDLLELNMTMSVHPQLLELITSEIQGCSRVWHSVWMKDRLWGFMDSCLQGSRHKLSKLTTVSETVRYNLCRHSGTRLDIKFQTM
jgi:hypothetical protein